MERFDFVNSCKISNADTFRKIYICAFPVSYYMCSRIISCSGWVFLCLKCRKNDKMKLLTSSKTPEKGAYTN